MSGKRGDEIPASWFSAKSSFNKFSNNPNSTGIGPADNRIGRYKSQYAIRKRVSTAGKAVGGKRDLTVREAKFISKKGQEREMLTDECSQTNGLMITCKRANLSSKSGMNPC